MKRIFRKLHLWLGLLSGLVVFIVCLTGALYMFHDEIANIGKPYLHVAAGQKLLPPSALIAKAEADSLTADAITYGQKDESAKVDLTGENGIVSVWLNPYNGKVLHVQQGEDRMEQFFQFLLRGHRSLWLPEPYGKYIVDYGVLLFFIVLLSGLVIWWPKHFNGKTARGRLVFGRMRSLRQKSFNLHNVLGFYALLPLLVAAFTGLILGMDWFARGLHSALSSGEEYAIYDIPDVEPDDEAETTVPALDYIYNKVRKEEPAAPQLYFALPYYDTAPLRVSVVHRSGSYYEQDNRFFNPFSGKEGQGKGIFAGRYNEKSAADTVIRMAHDLHEGRTFGLLGRLIMLLAALIGASLPVTGFILWWKKR